MFRIILESVLTAIEPITLLTKVGSYMANLPSFELLICLVLLDQLLYMTLILGTSADEDVTLSKSEHDSLIQKIPNTW